MTKLVVYLNGVDGFVNIDADRIEREDVFLIAYNGDRLVGMFDIGSVMGAYLSSKNVDLTKNGIERR